VFGLFLRVGRRTEGRQCLNGSVIGMQSTRNGINTLRTRNMNSVVLVEDSPRYRYIATLCCCFVLRWLLLWQRRYWVPWIGTASLCWSLLWQRSYWVPWFGTASLCLFVGHSCPLSVCFKAAT